MALPSALLQYVEQHGCFSGCYSSNSNVSTFVAPTQPPIPVIVVSCRDCFHQIGTPVSLLAAGTTSYSLADQLTQHVRARRGYTLSIGGYHAKGPGFYISAVYWSSCRLFLLGGENSRKLGTDLDLLQLAFRHSVLAPPEPGMIHAAHFTVETVHVDPLQVLPAVTTKQSLLQWPGLSTQAVAGWQKLTLAEFKQPSPSPPPSPPAPLPPPTATIAMKAAPATRKVGDRCPKCGAEVRERELLNRTFLGCLC